MDRCPNCRARWEAGDTCRRCGMELRTLLAVEQAAEGLTMGAIGQLARGEIAAALESLTRARALRPDPFIAPLLGFARQLADDPPRPQPAGPVAAAAYWYDE